ncbi:MAG: glycosyltransferase family 9 protein [Candidatus Glassbacteria bacterium]|nr:glycosyltransferase family 9 protein [Candidatus Glassbacteria bacterium]
MKNGGYKNVLVLNMGGIGDLVSTMPVLAALKNYGSKTITSVVWPAQEDLALIVPSIDRVVPLPVPWENDPKLSLFGRKLAGKFGYDLVLDFAFMPRSGILSREARGNRTVGFALERKRRPWYTDIFPNLPGELRLERNLRLIEQLGLSRPAAPDFRVKLPAETRKKLDKILRDNGIAPNVFPLAVHPGSGNSVRNWPAERFAELADKIAADSGAPVVLLGGRDKTYDGSDELSLVRRVIARLRTPAVDLAGKLDLPMMVALLQRCSLFAGNNSGPAHIAATLAGASSLLVWAPRNEKVWRPWGRDVVLVSAETDCADECELNQCDRIAECLAMISVDEVYRAYLATIGAPEQVAATGGSR